MSFKDILSDWKEAVLELSIFSHPRAKLAAVSLAVLAVVGYGVASQTTGAPNYTATYDNVTVPKGPNGLVGSKIVAVTSAIIRDEVVNRGWCPSESFLTPASWRTDTCAFQLGEDEIILRTVYVLREDIASEGSMSRIDSNLDQAVKNLNFGADVWGVFFSTDKHYVKAAGDLDAFNKRVVMPNGDAHIYPRINNLTTLLESIIHATGSQVEDMRSVESGGFFLTGRPRAAFETTKGMFHASCEIMKAMKIDFEDVLEKQSDTGMFDKAVTDVCAVGREETPTWSINLENLIKALQGRAAIGVSTMQNAHMALAGAANALK